MPRQLDLPIKEQGPTSPYGRAVDTYRRLDPKAQEINALLDRYYNSHGIPKPTEPNIRMGNFRFKPHGFREMTYSPQGKSVLQYLLEMGKIAPERRGMSPWEQDMARMMKYSLEDKASGVAQGLQRAKQLKLPAGGGGSDTMGGLGTKPGLPSRR